MPVLTFFRMNRMNIGTNSPRKSAPTRLNERPKYMHWPSTLSNDVTPRSRSASNVNRNALTFSLIQEWKMLPQSLLSFESSVVSSSANVARYCVMMLNRFTRLCSMVFIKWIWAANDFLLFFLKLPEWFSEDLLSSVGMPSKIEQNQLSRACKNFNFSSGTRNACIRRK